MRIRGLEMLVSQKILCTYLMDDSICEEVSKLCSVVIFLPYDYPIIFIVQKNLAV